MNVVQKGENEERKKARTGNGKREVEILISEDFFEVKCSR